MTNRIVTILTIVICLVSPAALAGESNNARTSTRDLRSLGKALSEAQNAIASVSSLSKDVTRYKEQLHDAFQRGDYARGTRLYAEYQRRFAEEAKNRARQLRGTRDRLASVLAKVEDKWWSQQGTDPQAVPPTVLAARRLAQLPKEEVEKLSEADLAALKALLSRARLDEMIRGNGTELGEFLTQAHVMLFTLDRAISELGIATTKSLRDAARLMSRMVQLQSGKAGAMRIPTLEVPELPNLDDETLQLEGKERLVDDVLDDLADFAGGDDGQDR